jgi:hypothetical protein
MATAVAQTVQSPQSAHLRALERAVRLGVVVLEHDTRRRFIRCHHSGSCGCVRLSVVARERSGDLERRARRSESASSRTAVR